MDPCQHIHITRSAGMADIRLSTPASTPPRQQPTPPPNVAPPPPYTSHYSSNASDAAEEDDEFEGDIDNGFSAFAADFNNARPDTSHITPSMSAVPSTPPPFKLTINAASRIHGSQNLVPTLPSLLADAARFSTVLLTAVKQLNRAANSASNTAHDTKAAPPSLHVDLTINCGVTVIGDRNVIGNVGMRPKPTLPKAAVMTERSGAGAVKREGSGLGEEVAVGAKRKAEENRDEAMGDGKGNRGAKRVDVGRD